MRFFVQLGFTLLTADLSFYAKYNLGITGTQQSILLIGTLVVALPLVYVWGLLVPKIGAFASEVLAITLFGLVLIPFIFAHTYTAALISGLDHPAANDLSRRWPGVLPVLSVAQTEGKVEPGTTRTAAGGIARLRKQGHLRRLPRRPCFSSIAHVSML